MLIKGQIININSSKYTIKHKDKEYVCTVKGIFRKKQISPLVGDYVDIDDEMRIAKIYPRKNFLKRPNISNVDIALILTSVKKPDLDLVLLDKLLVHIFSNNIKPIICFSKTDLLDSEELPCVKKVIEYYENIGISCILNTELEAFRKLVKGKTVVCCGQSGAGKSTFINRLDSSLKLDTNPISESLNRGVHTTRYVSLYTMDDFLLADTPGFSALDISSFTKEEIRDSFIEFSYYPCQYSDCLHINTDGCGVISEIGHHILESRYRNYQKFIKELNESSSKLSKK